MDATEIPKPISKKDSSYAYTVLFLTDIIFNSRLYKDTIKKSSKP